MRPDKNREPISFGLLMAVVGLALAGLWTGYSAYEHLARSYKYGAKTAEQEAKRDKLKKDVPEEFHKTVDARFESKIRKRDRRRKRTERKGYRSLKWAASLLLASGGLVLVRRRWMMHQAIRDTD